MHLLVCLGLLAWTLPARADFLGAAASHADRGGPIVVWSADALHVSRDDGAHFGAMPMPVTNVRDVVVEPRGTILVLGGTAGGEETQLSRIDAHGTVTVLDVPGWLSRVAAAGEVVVALMPYQAGVAISRHGGPFVLHPVPPAFGSRACRADETDPERLAECLAERVVASDASLAIDRDGTAHVVDVEVSTCGSSDVIEWARTLTVRPDGAITAARLTVSPTDVVYPTRWTAAPHGWAYAYASDGQWAALVSGRTRAIGGARGAPVLGGGWAAIASNGALTVGQRDTHVVRLDGARAQPLTELPALAGLADVDARGRVLAISESTLYRWSRRTGWSELPLGI